MRMILSKKTKNIFAAVIIVLIASLFAIVVSAASSGTHTPVTGVTVGVSGATDNSMTNGAVTVTAKGSKGVLGFGASAKTATITVSNNSGSTATISFDWTATSVNQLTIDGIVYTGTTGSFSKTLDEKYSFTITIVTAKNNTVNTLVMRNFAVVVLKESDVTFQYDNTLGSITVGGTSVASGAKQTISNSIELVATAKSDAIFVGWVDTANDSCLSRDTKYILAPAEDMTVKAVFTTASSKAWFLADKCLLNDLTAACEKAESADNPTVVLAASGVLPNGNYTIPSGVTLLIPYSKDHALITSDMASYVTEVYETPEEYRRLTLAAGAKIDVEAGGVLCVGSRAYRQASGQNGAYGLIEMGEDSQIVVNGVLYAWGYISGSGTIAAKSNSSVYQMLAAPDYANSASTTVDIRDDGGAFPMRAFSWQNVEVPLTIEYGSTLYGFYHIYGSNAGNHPGTLAIVGKNNDAIFQMTAEGSNATVSFKEGKQIVILNGSFALNPLSVTVSIYVLITYTETISSSDTSGIPFPGHFDIKLNSGTTVTLNEDVILTKGVKLNIEAGATLDANGKNIYVLDASDDAGVPASTNLAGYTVYLKDRHGNDYSQITDDATIIVNGTLKASGGFYTSKNGANISSTGKGRVIVSGTSSETSVALKINQGGYTSVEVSPAILQNADSSDVPTSGATSGTVYGYDGSVWYNPTLNVHSSAERTDGIIIDAEYRLQDYLWLNAVCYLDKSYESVDPAKLSITLDGADKVVVIGDDKLPVIYIVKKVPADEIADAISFIIEYDGKKSAPVTVSIRDCKDGTSKTDELVDALLAYGEAAKKYFVTGGTPDIKLDPESIRDSLKGSTAFGKTADKEGSYNKNGTSVTLTTKGANVLFEERLSLMFGFQFSSTGMTADDFLQVGVLIGSSDVNTAMTVGAGNVTKAYILYNNTQFTVNGTNKPYLPDDAEYKVTDKSSVTWDKLNADGRMVLYMDLLSVDYTSAVAFRPYAIAKDGTVIYGQQYAYGLADYINNMLYDEKLGDFIGGKNVDAFRNLLITTWNYALKAEAKFTVAT